MKIAPKVPAKKSTTVQAPKVAPKMVTKVVAPKAVAKAPAPVVEYVTNPPKETFLTEEDFQMGYFLDVLSILTRGHGIDHLKDGFEVNGIKMHTPLGRSFWVSASLTDKVMASKMLGLAYEATFAKKPASKTFHADTIKTIWKTLSSEYRNWSVKYFGKPEDDRDAFAASTVPALKICQWRKNSSKLFDAVGEFGIVYQTQSIKKATKPAAAPKPVVKSVVAAKPTATPNKAPVKFVPRAMAKVNAPSPIKNNMTKPVAKVNTVKKTVVASKK